MKIAIIGSGISGLCAAYALREAHDVTVYEKSGRAGGHSNTLTIDYAGRAIAVDTGFIVFNTRTYPLFTRLLAHLAVETHETDMSFSVSLRGGALEWGGSLRGVFAQKRNLLRPDHYRMLADIVRFNRRAPRDLRAGRLEGVTLGDYIALGGYGRAFADRYLLPLGAAIWSARCAAMRDFPAERFVAFCDNHRLLHATRPRWRTVAGGSQAYVRKMSAALGRRLRLGCGAVSIARSERGVTVTSTAGERAAYDYLILATHSDETLAIVADFTPPERAILGAIPYAPNMAYLHRDIGLMPKRRAAWASWNFIGAPDAPAGVTYWMNRLQSIDRRYPLFVSLNPPRRPDPALTFAEIEYAHPQFDAAALEAQRALGGLQGQNRTFFAGAYCGYGFHEDGLAAGLAAARALGAAAAWADTSPRLRREAAE